MSVQYITNETGNITSVILPIQDWEVILDKLYKHESERNDTEYLMQSNVMKKRLVQAKNRTGGKTWEEVKDALNDRYWVAGFIMMKNDTASKRKESNMEKAYVRVNMPPEIMLDFGLSEENVAMRMLKLFVIDLYKNKQISCGKGAELLGIRKYDFIRMIADEGVNYFDYSMSELDEEFNIIDRWENKNA